MLRKWVKITALQLTVLVLWIAHPSDGYAADDAATATRATVMVREYLIRGNTVLDPKTIERVMMPYLGPGKTLGDITAARDALQQQYHQLGYQSVYVALPQQRVAQGVVLLQVSETRVGRLRVTGAKYHSPLEIRERVPALSEGNVPNFNIVQQQLTAINSLSEQQIMPLVSTGRVANTMDVNLQVDDQRPWGGSIGLNNDYSVDTSELRAMVTLRHNNLWQAGHRASITYFTAPRDTDDASVYSGFYAMPLSNDWELQVTGFHSDSDVSTVNDTNVLGNGYSISTSLVYHWQPVDNWYHTASFGLAYKNFDEELRYGDDHQLVPLHYTPLTLSYNGFHSTQLSQSTLDLSLVGASRSFFSIDSSEQDFDDKRYLASPSFLVFKAGASHTFDFAGGWQGYVKGNFQLASGALVSNEQFSAGGASSVRGYYAAERSADDGFLVSEEWRTPPLTWLGDRVSNWRFYLFLDGARMRLRDPLPEQDDDYSLASAGGGMRLRIYDVLAADVFWAMPLTEGSDTEKHDAQVKFDLRADF